MPQLRFGAAWNRDTPEGIEPLPIDMFGCRWAQTWEQYHARGMTRPQSDEDLFGFE